MCFFVQISRVDTSDQSTLDTFPIPGSHAYPLNQGDSSTCSCHATANAVADQLADQGVDIDQKCLVHLLVQINGSIGPVWPDFYDNVSIDMQVQNETKWIRMKLTVEAVGSFSKNNKHVLAYHTGKRLSPHDYHCVFVKEQTGDYYECVNSWGKDDPNPKVHVNQFGNRLWMVMVKFDWLQAGLPFLFLKQMWLLWGNI